MNAANIARLALTATLALAASQSALADEAPVTFQNGVMVDAKGMTLYTFDKDVAGTGKSACNGQCAAVWPPLAAPAGVRLGGDFTVLTRDDGSQQIAHKGRPLYLYLPDQKPGDTTGDGSGGVWHVVKAAEAPASAKAAAPRSAPAGGYFGNY